MPLIIIIIIQHLYSAIVSYAGCRGADTVYCALVMFAVGCYIFVEMIVAVGKTTDVWVVIQHKRSVGNTQEFTAAAA